MYVGLCMSVYICPSVNIYIYIYTYARMFVFMCVCISVCIRYVFLSYLRNLSGQSIFGSMM